MLRFHNRVWGNKVQTNTPPFISPRCVVLYMQFTPKHLAFLEHEMEQIKDDPDRDYEDRTIASEIFGKVEGEIEWEKERQHNGNVSPEEIFS
ncbi:hypothetical protein M1M41_gp086 [Halorubrum sodomense tailed virus 4]|uniref:Uncharacterized protein n=1 Tax=Halorubrum sodomense tailed virus 4 TaxID=2878013 RepID=A0AAE9BVE8_9CAUD|nr:hypothetical protein M1M41_gp086 [Halorubrum sodomense tailed virus 4]UBF19747.1 hypothetical protein HRTV-18_gp38 [Halorubrum virus HRTV-18]UBF19870.1 hypothetical protein HRTV-20_gp38 [Halorubrum virus HRTV-20]UBF20245.1 hypothetical protein HSTV-4_gp38 [Halorubrum sodomense tailed virus 4]